VIEFAAAGHSGLIEDVRRREQLPAEPSGFHQAHLDASDSPSEVVGFVNRISPFPRRVT